MKDTMKTQEPLLKKKAIDVDDVRGDAVTVRRGPPGSSGTGRPQGPPGPDLPLD